MGDLALVAESVKILQHSPRPVLRAAGAEGYGRPLLSSGDREAALDQLRRCMDMYDRMGALAPRARVQRLMREAGARRAKCHHFHLMKRASPTFRHATLCQLSTRGAVSQSIRSHIDIFSAIQTVPSSQTSSAPTA